MIECWQMNVVDRETLNPRVLSFEIVRDGQAIVLVANSNDGVRVALTKWRRTTSRENIRSVQIVIVMQRAVVDDR